MIHLPHFHLLLEEVCKLLFPMYAIVFTATVALFVKPARCDVSVNLQVHHYFTLHKQIQSCPAFQSRSPSSLLHKGPA